MITCSLQSGSNGNAIFVEAGATRLLFDAGLSGKLARARLAEHGREIRDCRALFISHDHSDHTRCAGVYHRKFKIPVHATPATLSASWGLGRIDPVHHFTAGDQIRIDDVTVHTIPTPHDAVDGVAFVVEHAGRRLGILTDLGCAFPGLRDLLASLDAAYLESNYDPRMLEEGSYSPALKARIRGGRGHLSNVESALLLKDALRGRLGWVALAHLSEENNHPALALATHRAHVGESFPLHLASRYAAGPLLEV
jgi:phosphoribosyl 1,2-cyclic phosphodiesterase